MSLLIYGAYGYTGRLITDEAQARGLTPILAGRNAEKVHDLADSTGLPARVFSLDDPKAVARELEDVDVVLHCAGPFSHTADPMVTACVQTGTHYLDITGEIKVFEALAARDAEAADAGVMLCPGVGFDVVPTDCLVKHLSEQCPSATSLEVAFVGLGRASQGTLKTAVEQMGDGGKVRRNGEIVDVPPAWSTRTVDFGDHPRTVVSIPWGDVSTAYHSTGIPNITAYTYVPSAARRMLAWSRYLQWLLSIPLVQRLLKAFVEQQPAGPSEDERKTGATHVWAAATDPDGGRAEGRLHGPEGYTFTARAAVSAAQDVLGGTAPAGYQTPSTAFGADFVLDIEGVEREML